MKYKLRAECTYDTDALFEIINPYIIGAPITKKTFKGLPDVVVTFETSLSLEEIQDVLSLIKDSHVMRETLAIKSEYTGIRAL